MVGDIRPSVRPGRLVCDILDYLPFAGTVPIKRADGTYFEEDPAYWKGPVYWAQGVRPLSVSRYDEILGIAEAAPSTTGPIAAPSPVGNLAAMKKTGSKSGAYAPALVSAAVDAYAMKAALAHVGANWPGQVVEEMPKNNPGFDIRVGPAGSEAQFVEVKGTQSADPVFWMSEGERKFSAAEAHRYTLVVVVGIDLTRDEHDKIVQRAGEVGGPDVELETSQWRGKLLNP